MLLRSSSTPILGSLLSSSSSSCAHNNESPNKHHHHHSLGKASSLSSSSFPHIRKPSFAFNICPLPDSSPNSNESSPIGGFRRARSDGNLLSLLSSDHRSTPNHLLDSIPSLSLHSATGEQSREYNEDGERDDLFDEGSFVCQDNLKAAESSWGGGHTAAPLFLARGLGIDRIGSGLLTAGGGGGFDGGGSGGGGGGRGGGGEDRSDIENYYRRMVEENPSDALFLSNYAQFLYKTKGDTRRAEEYYSRAILAEPGDGEILSQYAKLVWELHHDKERASSYFEQAVRANPSDSNVLAAYANFLWETDDDDDGDDDMSSRVGMLRGGKYRDEFPLMFIN